MNRRSMLKGIGLLGLGSIVPLPKTAKAKTEEELKQETTTCWLTPQETEGPYYFNANLVRQDITTDTTSGTPHTGLPFAMTFTVINATCDPIPNVLVDIWHCDKDGVYSGYVQPGGINTVGQNFLRGIQMTDANGQCTFQTIYPGWYQGRATHIHFKVRLTSSTYVTSQFCFPENINTAVYATPLYVGRGANTTSNANDSVFQNANPQYLVMACTANSGTGGYDGAYIIGINATVGVHENTVEPGTFTLEQNYPNPFNPSTTIRYHLPASVDVRLSVYDVLGREVTVLVAERQTAGTHTVQFNASTLESGFYFYKITAGSFMDSKEMLFIK